MSLLLHRLAGSSNKPRLYQSLTGIVGVLGIVSFLVVAIRQNTGAPWIYTSSTVDSTLARWIANGVLSVVSDLLAIALSCYLVWNLQMGTNAKTLVITAFALRLFVLPVTIIRLVSLSRVNADDFSLSYALPEAYTQLEMYCNLIATTLPCLRLFLTAWNTNFMNMALEEVDPRAYQQRKCDRKGVIKEVLEADMVYRRILRNEIPSQQVDPDVLNEAQQALAAGARELLWHRLAESSAWEVDCDGRNWASRRRGCCKRQLHPGDRREADGQGRSGITYRYNLKCEWSTDTSI